MLQYFPALFKPMTVMASPYSFSQKNCPIMPLDQNPHQTVTRFGRIGFSMYACGFFTKIVKSKFGIFPSVVQAYTQPNSFGGKIKLISCQIRHELSVTIHEISTS